jgi:hypothetical protein
MRGEQLAVGGWASMGGRGVSGRERRLRRVRGRGGDGGGVAWPGGQHHYPSSALRTC